MVLAEARGQPMTHPIGDTPLALPSVNVEDLAPQIGPALRGYAQFSFAANNIVHPVYQIGLRSRPPVLVLQELPGFAPGLQRFAERLVQAGFQVYLPWLFGPFNERSPVENYLRLCVSREFARLKAGMTAPVTDWLRALVRHVGAHNEGRHVAAIGMCVTGGFVIPLLLEPTVVAAVAAQPAIPVSLAYLLTGRGGQSARAALNVSASDIAGARARLQAGEARVLAIRCQADRFCPADKLARLQREFPVGLTTSEYGEPDTLNVLGERPHATYTKEARLAPADDPQHYSQVAFQDLVAFLRQTDFATE